MSKIIIEDRRQHSYIKPFIYLFLQLVILWEMYFITTTTVPYKELIFNASMIVVILLIHQTFKILQRTSKSTSKVSSKKLSLSSETIK
jgi:hypothetical protein